MPVSGTRPHPVAADACHVHRRGVRLPARPQALRPAAHIPVHLAQRRILPRPRWPNGLATASRYYSASTSNAWTAEARSPSGESPPPWTRVADGVRSQNSGHLPVLVVVAVGRTTTHVLPRIRERSDREIRRDGCACPRSARAVLRACRWLSIAWRPTGPAGAQRRAMLRHPARRHASANCRSWKPAGCRPVCDRLTACAGQPHLTGPRVARGLTEPPRPKPGTYWAQSAADSRCWPVPVTFDRHTQRTAAMAADIQVRAGMGTSPPGWATMHRVSRRCSSAGRAAVL